MLSCKQAMRLASERLDRKLPLRARIGLKLHAMMCSGCRAVARQFAAIDQAVRLRFAGVEEETQGEGGLSDDARDRIRQAVRERLA